MEKIISASILSANILDLKNEIKKVEESGSDMLHFDVMDGVFVNNISFGFPVLEAVNSFTDMFLDVHLMISAPLKYAARFAESGADMITFHIESSDDACAVIKEIKNAGAKVGIALKPDTPFENVIPLLDKIDMLLLMTVEPGFGGQSYIDTVTDKIRRARAYITEKNIDISIQVDGGINNKTSVIASEAGANILVAGNYLFKADSMKDAVVKLRC